MRWIRPFCVACCGLALSVLPITGQSSLGQTPPPAAVQPPMRVTTDTPEYCASLARRIEREQQIRSAPMPQPAIEPPGFNRAEEIAKLTVEGRRMCDQGLVVGGITRLRHAWMLQHPRD